MLNIPLLKSSKIPIVLAVLSIIFYAIFAYDLARTDYIKLVTLYFGLFFLFYKLVQSNKNNFKFLVAIAFIFRFIFLLAIPNLSQDFYRFIWDGRMILEGYNPYLYTPESFISRGELPIHEAKELYIGMKQLNASHFTNYPPINQLCFIIAGLFSGKSIIGSAMVLRLLIIAADFGTLYFGKKLLEKLKIPINNIFWYILNPFIIIELTGNLHFESVMIFFLVWSLYLVHIGKWKWAAVIFACSISTKLVPLIFLPLFFKWFVHYKNNNKPIDYARGDNKNQMSGRAQSRPHSFIKLLLFYSIISLTTLLLFAPFFSSEFINNYSKTVGLWFGNFEFNASIYYVARKIGYWFRGWNEIAIIGKILPLIVFLFVLGLAFFKRNTTTKQLTKHMLFAFTFYLLMSTTVHPWYIATILIISVFTNYKFPLVWSSIVIISYLAYANSDHTENLWIIGFEYLVVYSVLIWEVFIKKPHKKLYANKA